MGLQWGDEGKGKIVDYLADRFDAVARFNGGSNAGHTVVVGKARYKLHLVPSGALRGKRLLIGAGVALDPDVLAQELRTLKGAGFEPDLLVDSRCTLVSPLEKEFDSLLEAMRGKDSLGTTRMGLGPAYAMRALRLTPRALDLLSGSFDVTHLKKFYRALGIKSAPLGMWLKDSRALLAGRLGDVASTIQEMGEDGENVLFEGAHGTLLDLVYGTYPFVTSSQTVAANVAPALGIPASLAGSSVGVVKSYATRVGAGPFPTEIAGATADKIRATGGEYGVTTGRPRRIGWLDLVALKYAARLNGVGEIALTKVDVLSEAGDLKACVAYRAGGRESSSFHDFLGELDEVEPVYESLGSLKGLDLGGRPAGALKELIRLVEQETGVRVGILSYGEERESTNEL